MEFLKRGVVGITCLLCILIITVCVVQVNIMYGLVGVFAFLLCAFASLQPYKLVYTYFARNKEYNNNLVRGITNCWTIYQIMNQMIFYGGVFSYLLLLADKKFFDIPQSIFFIVIIVLACLVSLKPTQPFVNKEKYVGARRRLGKLISAFVPRFVILYAFVVYYLLAYVHATTDNIIPSLCVAYIAIERLFTMFQTVSSYAEQEYYSLFRDTAMWMRKIRNMDKESESRSE